MAKYLFVYHGGGKPSNPEDGKKAMDAWGAWFGSLGAAVIDGGNPVGKSSTVKSDGSLVDGGGANPDKRIQPHRGVEPGRTRTRKRRAAPFC